MTLEVDLAVRTLPVVAAGVAMLGLAGALLYVNPRHRLNRAFALFLVVRGFTNVLVPVVRPLEGAGEVASLGSAIDLVLVFPAIHFGLSYREVEHEAAYPRWVPPVLLVGALTLLLVWLVAPETGAVNIEGPPEIFQVGPLYAVSSLTYTVVLAGIGLLLIRDAVRATDGIVRTSSLLLAVAFLAWPAYLGISEFLGGISGLGAQATGTSVQDLDADEAPRAGIVVFAACWLSGLGAIAYLYRAASDRPELLRPARLVAVGLGVVLLSASLPYQLLLLDVGTVASRASVDWIAQGLGLLAMPLLGFYALIRHQVFGVDLKVRFAVRQSTIAATFLAIFFVTSEGAAAFLGERLNSTYLGIAAAALLVFALAPLQRLADRLADAAVPGAQDPEHLGQDERLAIYRDQVRFAWADRALSQEERALLGRLREQLGLSADQALRVENEVLGSS